MVPGISAPAYRSSRVFEFAEAYIARTSAASACEARHHQHPAVLTPPYVG
ncbi:hypothetical protein B0H15DRAFT_942374 [Mycena belliarum]|uniref:Uncharacterized protein n=1 Tax=Mycena belliarum TaxID=1033014 RepID=A0AAD6UN85_9AGAR|nr:hypothetical protein B0H15DRAFT_942374 [Mycena belliae]